MYVKQSIDNTLNFNIKKKKKKMQFEFDIYKLET